MGKERTRAGLGEERSRRGGRGEKVGYPHQSVQVVFLEANVMDIELLTEHAVHSHLEGMGNFGFLSVPAKTLIALRKQV